MIRPGSSCFDFWVSIDGGTGDNGSLGSGSLPPSSERSIMSAVFGGETHSGNMLSWKHQVVETASLPEGAQARSYDPRYGRDIAEL